MDRLVLATLLFYALHSALAMDGVKRWASTVLGLVRWYRLLYSILSILLLGLVAWAYANAPRLLFFTPSALSLTIGLLLMCAGAVLAICAVAHTGALGFLGLRTEAQRGLLTTGLYAHLRHPIYSGIILIGLGGLLMEPSRCALVLVLITFVYLPIGIRHEEQRLVREHGSNYEEYRRKVPALWPQW